jgi:hypothetical protein
MSQHVAKEGTSRAEAPLMAINLVHVAQPRWRKLGL